ncbi:hypothetical protein [Sporosarcina koreensis]|uniref:Uncharacterized protein n=1 Tax=Sporosarcina koreensis TaxID=334735 RepID=A0ABW0TY68_9BACL
MKNYEVRHIFMAIGLGILVISPFLLLPLPTFVATNIHDPQGWVVILPGKAYLLYAFGFLFLSASALILFVLNLSKAAKIGSIASLLFSAFFFVSAIQIYTSLSGESISFRESLWSDRHSYAWEEVEKVHFNLAADGFPKYEFYFKDGNELTFSENGHIRMWRTAIEGELKKHEIEFEKKYN